MLKQFRRNRATERARGRNCRDERKFLFFLDEMPFTSNRVDRFTHCFVVDPCLAITLLLCPCVVILKSEATSVKIIAG
jgi:hypothetical protein